eukprot:12202703-Prorocentrum_lima.AAC.1
MTSSLVGSEMCIRDRSSVDVQSYQTYLDSIYEEQQKEIGMHAQENNSSVSYTHLTLPTICSV